MKIHEYQAKDLFSTYAIPVEQYILCDNSTDAVLGYEKLSSPSVVVKAQVHTGGRGKAGGVKLAKNRDEVDQ